MDYKTFIKEQRNTYEDLNQICEVLANPENKNFLVYSHDDPDGVAAAAILTRYLERSGRDYQLELPHTFELETERVKERLQQEASKYDALIIMDKGTLAKYDELTELIEPVMVIDHHYTAGEPENCLLYNPEGFCCSGLQAHMIVELVDQTDSYDDFLALIALRSDWTIRPLKDMIPEFVEPFFNEVKEDWKPLLEPIESRPTWMEIDQRKYTLLLNQIAELVFAVSGGGFSYFYGDRDDELAELDATWLCYEDLMEMGRTGVDFSSVSTLEEAIDLFPRNELVARIFDYFCADWDRSLELFESSMFFGELGEVDLFLFTGEDTPLMPMVGSVKLGDISRKNGDKPTVMVMANHQSEGGCHFSFRGTSDLIHLGKIADLVSNSLAEQFDCPDEITGGGHLLAAEVKIFRTDIEPAIPFRRLVNHLTEIYELAQKNKSGGLSEDEKEKAIELGLEYLTE
ncbi:MAG: DHH family phosphoesterase [bacterium]